MPLLSYLLDDMWKARTRSGTACLRLPEPAD